VDEVEGPIGWLVVKGKKGHLSQERHIELLAMVQELVGEAGQVMVLGDGVFDGNPPFALTLSPNALFKKTVRCKILFIIKI
jgi:hypothetical protein